MDIPRNIPKNIPRNILNFSGTILMDILSDIYDKISRILKGPQIKVRNNSAKQRVKRILHILSP